MPTQVLFADAEHAAIEQVRLDLNAAYSRGDAQALGELIDHEAIWMPPGKPALVGKEAVVEHYTRRFATLNSRFELKPGNIQLLQDWALLWGTFERTDTDSVSSDAHSVQGHYLLVLRKQPDGRWKIAHDIWNEYE